MSSLRITVFAAILAFAAAQCGSGLQSCNGQCFLPTANSCPIDSFTYKQVLCPLNFAACNGACYSPTQYHCANGGLQAGPETPKASTSPVTTSSTQATPASTTSAAASGQTCNTAGCPTGLCNCNGGCYSPSQYNCALDPYTGKSILCYGTFGACNGQCYDSSAYSCKNGGLVQGGGQTPTPTPTSTTQAAPKPTTSSTQAVPATTTTTVAVPVTSSTPAVTSSSSTCNTAGCPTGLCNCNGGCYSPSQYNCALDSYTGKTMLCYGTFGACNGQCFDSSAYSCKNGGLVQGGGQTPTPTPTSTSAPKPTTSSTQAVPVTSSNPVASTSTCNTAGCGVGTCNCNGACYTPGQYNCPVDSFTGKTLLCSGSLAACNGQCYDSSAYSCKNGGIVQGAGQTPSTNNVATSPVATTSSPNPVVNPNPVPNKYPTQTADLRIINSCKNTLWFEARYGNQGAPIPGQSVTATIALPGSYVDYTIPSTGLSGSRFWAKYGCDSNGRNCLVGDQMQYWPNPPGGCPTNGCTPPVDSLFEATWGCRPGTGCNSQNPTTWFDTSQVDGWTIPYKLTPNGDTSGCDCIGTQCGFSGVDASRLDLARCPRSENLATSGQSTALVNGKSVSLTSVDLRIINNGSVLGCLSPCKRLNWGTPYGLAQSESEGSTLWMCCPTPTPDNCSPANGCVTPTQCRNGPIETTQFVAAVHDMAPGIYSYSYDDGVGLHACPAGVVTYTMEFCPAGSSQYPSPA